MKGHGKERKKQRFMGAALIAAGILAVLFAGGDATITFLTVPLGLYLIFTKEILIGNDFHRETEEGGEDEWKRQR